MVLTSYTVATYTIYETFLQSQKKKTVITVINYFICY